VIYIIGASGSGKSSLVAAGLVPKLTRGGPGLPSFVVRTMRPGERPLDRLAEKLEGSLAAPSAAVGELLVRHAPASSLLLVIDQLEELFAGAKATWSNLNAQTSGMPSVPESRTSMDSSRKQALFPSAARQRAR